MRPANPLEAALGEASGWAGVDNLFEQASKANEAHFEQMLELASWYRQAFTTEAGKRVLEDLAAQFLFQRVVQPNDTQFAVGIRQGQQDVVRRLLAMVDFANTGGGRPTGQPQGSDP